MSIFNKIITKVFGKKSDKDLKKINPIINQINDEYSKFNSLSDKDLKNIFLDIKSKLASIIQDYKDKNQNSDSDDELKEIEKEYLMLYSQKLYTLFNTLDIILAILRPPLPSIFFCPIFDILDLIFLLPIFFKFLNKFI